jgi:uncharacterized protein YjbI with pentapeptide repeats
MLPLSPPPAVIARTIATVPQKGKNQPLRMSDPRQQSRRLEIRNTRFSHSLFDHCFAQSVTFHNVAMPGLSFDDADLSHAGFNNINFRNGKISNANLSDLEIDGAQLGGAYLHHIGPPPPGHPARVEGAQQRPLRFEECDLHGSTIRNSDLSAVSISRCKLRGLTIDGIPVEDLLAAYREKHPAPPSATGQPREEIDGMAGEPDDYQG